MKHILYEINTPDHMIRNTELKKMMQSYKNVKHRTKDEEMYNQKPLNKEWSSST